MKAGKLTLELINIENNMLKKTIAQWKDDIQFSKISYGSPWLYKNETKIYREAFILIYYLSNYLNEPDTSIIEKPEAERPDFYLQNNKSKKSYEITEIQDRDRKRGDEVKAFSDNPVQQEGPCLITSLNSNELENLAHITLKQVVDLIDKKCLKDYPIDTSLIIYMNIFTTGRTFFESTFVKKYFDAHFPQDLGNWKSAFEEIILLWTHDEATMIN